MQFGDHDPSDADAWREFTAKVTAFAPAAEVEFVRLAVTVEQIAELNLPTRPTKQSDTRARNLAGGSVEVDAIPPSVLRRLLEDAIRSRIDADALELTDIAEASERSLLYAMIGPGS